MSAGVIAGTRLVVVLSLQPSRDRARLTTGSSTSGHLCAGAAEEQMVSETRSPTGGPSLGP
jgi:hypothetical protein